MGCGINESSPSVPLPLTAQNGGTGQSLYTVGDMLYASGVTTLSKLSAGAAGTFLRFAGAGVAPQVSTLVLPNAATANSIVYATSANTYGESANLTYNGTTFQITNSDTSTLKVRELVGVPTNVALYLNQTTPSGSNYTLSSSGTTGTNINTPSPAGLLRLYIGNTLKYTIDSTSHTWAVAGSASGTTIPFTFTTTSSAGLTAGTEVVDVLFNVSAAKGHATGALALQRAVVINQTTLTFTLASTCTNAATFGINGGPISGTNATITNSHGILISSNISVAGAGTVTNAFGITANAPTGATNNYAAQFIGGLGVLLPATNLITDTTTGMKICDNTAQKLAFWNKTPIVQPTTGITGATRVGGAGTTVTTTDTFGGYTIAQLAAVIINTGLAA